MQTTRIFMASYAMDPRECTARALFNALPGLSSITVTCSFGRCLKVRIRARIPGQGKITLRASGYTPANAVRNTLLALDRFPSLKTLLRTSPSC